MMNEDSVLRELRSVRDAYAQAHGYDVQSMVADLKERDERGDRPVVRLAPRRPRPASVLQPEPASGTVR